MISFQSVSKVYRDGDHRARRRRPDHRHPHRQDHRVRRPVRLRQDHVAADDQPDDRADLGARSLIDGTDTRSIDAPTLRRGIGYVIQNAGLFPHRTVLDNIATVPVLQGKSRRQARARRPATAGPGRAGRRDGPPLPGPAVRRAAAAGRGGPGAGRRPAGDADGRAVLGRRPRGPRPAAGRVHPAAGRARQDHRVRHPRHRRGGQARRPDRGVRGRRPARPVRPAGRGAQPAGRRLRRRLRRPRPRLPGAVVRRGRRPAAARRADRARWATRCRRTPARRPRDRRRPGVGCWWSTTRTPARAAGWTPARAGRPPGRGSTTWCSAARWPARTRRCGRPWTRRCPRRPVAGSRSTRTGG